MRTHYIVLLVAAFALALVAAPVDALVVKKDLPHLSQDAHSVVLGRVVSMESRWDDEIINTYVTVRVREHVKGAPVANEVIVRVAGGEVGDMGLYVSDAPWFEPGEEVMVFLARELKGAYSVEGEYQGKFSVKNGTIEELDLPVGEVVNVVKAYKPHKAKPIPTCYKLCGYTWKTNGSYSNGKWGPGNQGWSINNNSQDGLSDSQVGTAFRNATGAWDAAGACWAFGQNAGTITHDNITGAVQNYVNMSTFGSTGSSVATTYNWYLRSDKKSIIETDLVFNDAWLWGYEACGSSNAFDLQEVATHEFGHWLCVADLYGSGDVEKTMYGYVDYGECYKRTLHQCDIDAIKAIYGTCAASAAPVAMERTEGGRASLGEVFYSVTQAGPVTVRVFDIAGRLMKVLVNEPQAAGTYRTIWDGTTQGGGRAAAGVYFYMVETPGSRWSNKLIILK
ncbi:MAG: matrixin family metalloprotease [Candidatus Eisenbacteria bacterium]